MTRQNQALERYKRLAQESAAERAKSDAILLSMGEGVIAADEKGRITRINKVALDLLGKTESELLGQSFYQSIIATDERGRRIADHHRPITKALTTHHAISTKCFYQRNDTSLLAVSVNVAPIMLDDRVIGAIEVFRDITVEVEIDRMKSEFISLASHQLRTPATIVKNYLSLLIDNYGGALNETQQYLASVAYESNERQLDIVNNLLTVANTEATSLLIEKEPVNLSNLILHTADLMSGIIHQREQTLTLDILSDVMIMADASYIKMAIENLLSNASKYTPRHGAIGLNLDADDRNIIFSVTDTGVGIDTRHYDRLFKKFSRIDNPLSTEVGGSGIGLYLLKQIVDLHEGRAQVTSRLQKGSTFTIILPNESH